MDSRITPWLDSQAKIPDFYSLLGFDLFDPDRDAIRDEVKVAYRDLIGFQDHSNPAIADRALQLQRQLAWATALLSDRDALAVYHRSIVDKLYRRFRKETTLPTDLPAIILWLQASGNVHASICAELAGDFLQRLESTAEPSSSAAVMEKTEVQRRGLSTFTLAVLLTTVLSIGFCAGVVAVVTLSGSGLLPIMQPSQVTVDQTAKVETADNGISEPSQPAEPSPQPSETSTPVDSAPVEPAERDEAEAPATSEAPQQAPPKPMPVVDEQKTQPSPQPTESENESVPQASPPPASEETAPLPTPSDPVEAKAIDAKPNAASEERSSDQYAGTPVPPPRDISTIPADRLLTIGKQTFVVPDDWEKAVPKSDEKNRYSIVKKGIGVSDPQEAEVVFFSHGADALAAKDKVKELLQNVTGSKRLLKPDNGHFVQQIEEVSSARLFRSIRQSPNRRPDRSIYRMLVAKAEVTDPNSPETPGENLVIELMGHQPLVMNHRTAWLIMMAALGDPATPVVDLPTILDALFKDQVANVKELVTSGQDVQALQKIRDYTGVNLSKTISWGSGQSQNSWNTEFRSFIKADDSEEVRHFSNAMNQLYDSCGSHFRPLVAEVRERFHDRWKKEVASELDKLEKAQSAREKENIGIRVLDQYPSEVIPADVTRRYAKTLESRKNGVTVRLFNAWQEAMEISKSPGVPRNTNSTKQALQYVADQESAFPREAGFAKHLLVVFEQIHTKPFTPENESWYNPADWPSWGRPISPFEDPFGPPFAR